jgi:hypothetical protein
VMNSTPLLPKSAVDGAARDAVSDFQKLRRCGRVCLHGLTRPPVRGGEERGLSVYAALVANLTRDSVKIYLDG